MDELIKHQHNCLTCQRPFFCERVGSGCEEVIALVTEGCQLLDTCNSHRISKTMDRGLPIIGKHKGAFCPLCGDYIRHVDRESEDRTQFKGCERCMPTYEQRKSKGFADKLIKDNLIFNEK